MADEMLLPAIDDGRGTLRRCGTLMPPPGFNAPPRKAVKLLPQDQWVEFDLRDTTHPIKIKDQGQYGACVGHATATAIEWARFLANMDHVDLSAFYLYAILCGGIDRGASIAESLTLAAQGGTPPETEHPWGVINPRKISAKAKQEAVRFTLEIGSPLTTFAEMMTETQLSRPGNFSIHVGARFNNLDADGCPPMSGGAGNHAVAFGLGAKRARNGEWLILCQNSWTPQWGDGGFFWLREGHVKNQAWFEAYSIGAVVDDPKETNRPPVAA